MDTIKLSGAIKYNLAKNGFYNEYKLTTLLEYLIQDNSSYISSSSIDPVNKKVQIQLKKAYFDRHFKEDKSKFNALCIYSLMYNTMLRFYKNFQTELISILTIPVYRNMIAKRDIMESLYSIERIGENTIIFNFI